jgi:hypothetical protein
VLDATLRCFNCGKNGHMSKLCPDPQRATTCYLCGKVGSELIPRPHPWPSRLVPCHSHPHPTPLPPDLHCRRATSRVIAHWRPPLPAASIAAKTVTSRLTVLRRPLAPADRASHAMHSRKESAPAATAVALPTWSHNSEDVHVHTYHDHGTL